MKYQKITHSQKGLTLVEIMIAVTISLVLLAGIMQIFLSSKQSYNIQQALSRVQENARLVTDIMLRDVTAAGYMGCLGATDEIVSTLSDQTASYDYAVAIEGTEGGDDPDSITIRRVIEGMSVPVAQPMDSPTSPITLDTGNLNYASLNQWDVVTVSDCAGAAVFMITNDPATSDGVIQRGTASADTPPESHINNGQSNSTDDLERIFGSQSATTAKLYRVGSFSYQVQPSDSGNTSSLFISGDELVEGVEDLQIEYGIANSPTNSSIPTIAEQYVDADAVTAGNNWNDVIAVRITFVVNSGDLVVNPGDGDGRLRKTFSTTIRLRNRVPA